MEDKKSFGSFIAEKRKALHYTQKELAHQLNISETAVSKWERGISYPDITMISSICDLLHITEKEFIMAADDMKTKEEQKFLEKIKKGIQYSQFMLGLLYGLTAMICFIVNYAIDRTLSWSWLVLIALLIAFSCTHLPFKFKRYKLMKSFAVISILIYILVFTVKYTEDPGINLGEAYLIITINLIAVWLALAIISFVGGWRLKSAFLLIDIGIFTAFSHPIVEWLSHGVFDLTLNPQLNLPIGIGVCCFGVVVWISCYIKPRNKNLG